MKVKFSSSKVDIKRSNDLPPVIQHRIIFDRKVIAVIGLVLLFVVALIVMIVGLLIRQQGGPPVKQSKITTATTKSPEVSQTEVASTTKPIPTTLAPEATFSLEAGCAEISTIYSCSVNYKCDPVDGVWKCPSSSASEEVTIECYGKLVPFSNDTSCECLNCLNQNPTKTISGTVTKASDGLPIKYGDIEINGTRVARTTSKGKYSFLASITFNWAISILYTGDDVMPAVKVVSFNTDESEITLDVQLGSPENVVTFNGDEAVEIDLGDNDKYSIASMAVPENSVVDQHGNIVTGPVTVYLSTLNTNRPEDLENVPNTFETSNGTLNSAGMFIIDIDCGTGLTCALESVTITANSSFDVDLWVINEETSLWERVLYSTSSRKKRSVDSITFQNVRIEVRRFYNLDQLFRDYCYARVRVFHATSPAFITQNQERHDATIRALYEGSDGSWLGYQENYARYENDYYFCARVPCDDTGVVEKVHISAKHHGKPMYTGNSPSTAMDSSYQYTKDSHTHSFVASTSGNEYLSPPLYTSWWRWWNWDDIPENYTDCWESSYDDSHFQFYRDDPIPLEPINYVPFTEATFDIPRIEQANPLFWYPNEESFSVCYLKVKFEPWWTQYVNEDWFGGWNYEEWWNATTFLISSTSYGVTTSEDQNLVNLKDHYIGTRFAQASSEMSLIACIEYKCADQISAYDNGVIDNTRVVVKIEHSSEDYWWCRVKSVNNALEEHLNDSSQFESGFTGHYLGSQTDEWWSWEKNTFEMHAPNDALDTHGIFIATGNSNNVISERKNDALNACLAGSSFNVPDPVVVTDENVAVVFEC